MHLATKGFPPIIADQKIGIAGGSTGAITIVGEGVKSTGSQYGRCTADGLADLDESVAWWIKGTIGVGVNKYYPARRPRIAGTKANRDSDIGVGATAQYDASATFHCLTASNVDVSNQTVGLCRQSVVGNGGLEARHCYCQQNGGNGHGDDQLKQCETGLPTGRYLPGGITDHGCIAHLRYSRLLDLTPGLTTWKEPKGVTACGIGVIGGIRIVNVRAPDTVVQDGGRASGSTPCDATTAA